MVGFMFLAIFASIHQWWAGRYIQSPYTVFNELCISSRSKWRRSWKTHTWSRWQGCTLNTRLNVTYWKTWGMVSSTGTVITSWSHCLVWLWRTHQHNHARNEKKDATDEWGRRNMKGKMRKGGIVIPVWEGQRGWKRKEFPAPLFLLCDNVSLSLFHPFQISFHLSLVSCFALLV